MRALLFLSLVTFSVVSWYTTATGFIGVLGDTPPAVGYLLSAALQVVLAIASLHLIPQHRADWARLIVWTPLYVVVAATSVTFGIGFYFSTFSAKDFGQDLFGTAFVTIYRQASTQYRDLDHATARTEQLSRMSAELAEVEATQVRDFKGTCRNSRRWGQGPAFHKRRYQATRFAEISGALGQARARVKAVIDRMKDLESSGLPIEQRLQELNRLYQDFRVDYEYVRNNSYLAEIAQHIEWEFAGFPDLPEFSLFAGAERACQDGRTVAAIKAVLDLQLPAAADIEIPRFSPTDRNQVIQRVMADIAINAGLLSRAPNDTPVLGDRRYLMPLAAGLLVDVLILAIAIAIGLTRRSSARRRGDDPERVQQLWRALAPLSDRYPGLGLAADKAVVPETVGDAAEATLRLLNLATLKVAGHRFVALPDEHKDSDQILSDRGLQYLAMVTDLAGTLEEAGLLGRRIGPVTEYRGWSLLEIVRQNGLGPTDFGINGHFRVHRIDDQLFGLLSRLTGDNRSAFAEPRRWWRPAGASRAAILPAAMVRDRNYLAGRVHERLVKRGETWELTLNPRKSALDRHLSAWLSDDDDRLSEIVAEIPASLFAVGKRRFRLDAAAKRHIEGLVITTRPTGGV